MYRVTETESLYPDYSYHEDYKTHEDAHKRMLEMYHYVAIEGNPEVIVKAGWYENSAFVELCDDNTVEWEITEV
jgi:hypothetical protein